MKQQRYFSSGSEIRYKLIMVGEPNVGKTTIFWKYIEGEFLAQKPTTVTTIDFKIKQIKIDQKPVKLYIWDTAGQERFRSIVSTYFKGCDGVMLVFDLSDASTFQSVTNKWFQISKSKSPNASVMLIGNKSDLNSAVDDQQVQNWCKQHHVMYMKTSVKNDTNVTKSFQDLSQAIYNRTGNPPKTQSFALRNQENRNNKKGCC